MRLSRVLPALCLLFGVCASQLDSRVPHTLDTRELLDVCATITADLLDTTLLYDFTALGLIDVCLCLSALPLTTATLNASVVATLGGASFLSSFNTELAQLINQAAASNKCNYPAHSKPICGSKKCAFQCVDGYTPSPHNNPTQCKCPQTMQVCNGQCVAQGACPSQQPRSNYRRWLGSGSCAEKGNGWLACGVYGNHPSAWECVNTARDLESCGGCVLPLTAYSPKGEDCSAIHNVADVACERGECVVRRCLHGLMPSADANSCVSKSEYEGSHHHHHHGEKGGDSPKAYGLKHIPLQLN